MFAEIQRLEPERQHVLVTSGRISAPASTLDDLPPAPPAVPRESNRSCAGAARRSAVSRAAARGVSARAAQDPRVQPAAGAASPALRTWIASWLFLRGVPLDRIFLRPKWLVPWKRDRSVYPTEVQEIEGRPLSPRRRRIAVVSPVLPVSALARRRGADFLSAARDGRGVRHFSLRLPRSGNARQISGRCWSIARA